MPRRRGASTCTPSRRARGRPSGRRSWSAFGGLADVDYNLAASANARQVVDLAWGATLTRFLSISAGQRGKDFLSVGRVQSPTLALIVDREKEIRAFVPTPYWEVHATVHK